jgi:hypothetical protein
MRRGRRAVRLGVVLIFMCDAIRHVFHMLFGNPEPIEVWMLVADVLIVVLILVFDMPEWLHKRKYNKRVASLAPFVNRGIQLQRDVPVPLMTNLEFEIVDWVLKVNTWSTETSSFLAEYSQRASTFFSVIGPSIRDSFRINTSAGSFHVPPDAEGHYQQLLAQLANLQRIIEKPDAYF